MLALILLFIHLVSACSGGTAIGAFIVGSPNRSTVAVVGTEMTITWSFTPLVTIVPDSINIFLAFLNPQVEGLSFNIPVLMNVSSSTNQTTWTVSALNDGLFEADARTI